MDNMSSTCCKIETEKKEVDQRTYRKTKEPVENLYMTHRATGSGPAMIDFRAENDTLHGKGTGHGTHRKRDAHIKHVPTTQAATGSGPAMIDFKVENGTLH